MPAHERDRPEQTEPGAGRQAPPRQPTMRALLASRAAADAVSTPPPSTEVTGGSPIRRDVSGPAAGEPPAA